MPVRSHILLEIVVLHVFWGNFRLYKVLYRKYRPRRFFDVVGQPQVTVTLKNELKSGRISHAYLFTGTRGTGKTTCAKILAKAVNCLNPVEGDACGECAVCCGVDDGTLLDVVEIDAASNNGVDSIRALIEEANFTPTSAKYRVYIIDEVHMLSTAAFNALLKTLEEPPAHVIFILATTEVHRLLPTILSRCQRFSFKRIIPDDVADRLEYIAENEGVQIERDAALLIARITDGELRNAISILDQCFSRAENVTVETVNETAGIANQAYLGAFANAILTRNTAQALETVADLYKNAKDMNRLCEEMAEYFRNLMIIKTMRKPENILTLSKKELEEMTKQALKMDLSLILHSVDTFNGTLDKMRFANSRTEMELAFVKLCSPQLDTTPEAIVRRLEAVERGVPVQTPAAQATSVFKQGTVPETVPVQAGKMEESAAVQQEPPYEAFVPQAPEMPEEPLPERPIPQPAAWEEAPAAQQGKTADAAAPAAVPKPMPAAQPPFTSAEMPSIEALSSTAQPFYEWAEILEGIRAYSSSVAAAFSGSTAYISGEYMLIDAPQLAFELLKRQSQRERMRDAIRQATGRVYKLGPYRKKSDGDKPEEGEDPLVALVKKAEEAGIPVEKTE